MGNPCYDWERHLETGFNWWMMRLAHTLRLYDIVRIDHFRGLLAYWEVPANVSLEYDAPPGVTVEFSVNETNFTLQPGEHKRILVVLRVGEDVVPGSYKVAITTKQHVKHKGGGPVVVLPAATQEITLRVSGLYGYVNIYALDPTGAIAGTALVRFIAALQGPPNLDLRLTQWRDTR